MYYTKLLILTLLFIGGCTTSPSTSLSKKSSDRDQNRESIPSDIEITLYRQAITELNNSELEKSKISFQRMIEIQPDLAGPWANLALIQIKQQQYEKAEKNITIALEKNPNMAQALNMAGYIANRRGYINKAKHFYEKAIVTKPDYPLAHYNLALLYDLYLQNIPKAVEHYQQYLALISYEDKNTMNWVEELQLSIKSDDT